MIGWLLTMHPVLAPVTGGSLSYARNNKAIVKVIAELSPPGSVYGGVQSHDIVLGELLWASLIAYRDRTIMRRQVDDRTRTLIESVVSKYLDGHEIQACNIHAEVDDDGVENLVIDLAYKLSAKPVDPARSLDMLSEMGDSLMQSGDSRFPYVEHHFDDKQQIKGMQRAC